MKNLDLIARLTFSKEEELDKKKRGLDYSPEIIRLIETFISSIQPEPTFIEQSQGTEQ